MAVIQAGMPKRSGIFQATATLGALGVVYGDIGTSPLYALKEAARAAATSGGTITPDAVLGIVSLILWALILIISVKYALLILRADNHGEGGIVALLALLSARNAEPGTWRAGLLVVGLVGAALLYGDGAITPAISVLSALEGLKVDAPALAPAVVPLTVVILVGLFAVQKRARPSSAASSGRSCSAGSWRSPRSASTASPARRPCSPPSVPPMPSTFCCTRISTSASPSWAPPSWR